jgi:hypothetical protein
MGAFSLSQMPPLIAPPCRLGLPTILLVVLRRRMLAGHSVVDAIQQVHCQSQG